MTGNDIYRRVLGLMGYLDKGARVTDTANLLNRVWDIMNQMCAELGIPLVERLSDEVVATPVKLDALCYGTAMILALCEGDAAKNELFAKLYNAKRAKAMSSVSKVKDNLPNVSYGVD